MLNPAQREAVQTPSGPLLVLAGAGTGKTRVVTYRIAELTRHGVDPRRILAVTFTNKAAQEMRHRVGKLLKARKKMRPEISTYHSLCARILRRHIRRLGYPEAYGICDRSEQLEHARTALREIQVHASFLRPGDLINCISSWKQSGLAPSQASAAADSDRAHLAAAAYRRYQQSLKVKGMVDYDDLLLLTDHLFQKHGSIRRDEAGRFDHLLVDEYQDTNTLQYRITKTLAAGHRNLCVVGDDDQSIYGWRGAEVTHIIHFTRDWPEAKVIRLEENYRSTGEILQVANRLIQCNRTRHVKVLRSQRPAGARPRISQFPSEEEEARGVIDDIQSQLKLAQAQPQDFAILCRTNQQPRSFETELRRAELPYVLVGTTSYYDRKEVRDVLAYLRVAANPEDETALLRIINTPPRGIGSGAVSQLIEQATQQGISVWKVIRSFHDQHGKPQSQNNALNPSTLNALRKFDALIETQRARLNQGSLCAWTSDWLRTVNYAREMDRCYRDPNERQSRQASIENLLAHQKRYERKAPRATLRGFLDEVALAGRTEENDKESQLERNAVVMMTLHSAKGLEFPQVYLVGLEEGILPHQKSIDDGRRAVDEERRLCYVGITRAQNRLNLSLALSRKKWGKSRPTQPSRFLFELTGQQPPARHRPQVKSQN